MLHACYRWSFTWNKPETVVEAEFNEQWQHVLVTLESNCVDSKFIFQLERGLESKKLHYQGHIKIVTKERLTTLARRLQVGLPGLHISPDSNVGSTNAELYCMKKDSSWVAGPWCDKKYLLPDYSDILQPVGWCKQMMDIMLQPAHNRHIYWIYESEGCSGKSNFATYMELHHGMIGLGLGTANDNFYAVSELPARGYIFDVPRTLPKRFDWAEIYMSLEKIKDRNFLSTKYKPKKVLLPVIPHVVVVSNVAPLASALSIDRWKVFKINGRSMESTLHPVATDLL